MINPVTNFNFIMFILTVTILLLLKFLSIDRYLKYYKKRKIGVLKAFIFYSVPFIGILLFFLLIDMGLLNELRKNYILITIGFFVGYDVIVFQLIKKITDKQALKAVVIISLVWFLLFFSFGANESYSFSSRDLKRQWEANFSEFLFNNVSYNISTKISSSVENHKGFFVFTPFSLHIYDSTLRFIEGKPPNNTEIIVQIELFPHCYLETNNSPVRNLIKLDTIPIGNNTYRINTSDEYWILFYDSSGEKYISGKIYFNGTKIVESKRVPFIEIEKGYVRAQVEMTRAITILTFWLIFLGLLPLIDRAINWLVETYPEKFHSK